MNCVKQALQQLIETEVEYVEDLDHIVNGYKKETNNTENGIQIPENLSHGKLRILFGNVKKIYEWHQR